MPSPRNRLELVCRLGAFALVGWLLGIMLMPAPTRRLERATTRELATRLPEWTRAGGNVAVHVDVSNTPEAWAIDWLAALRRSGRSVTWSGAVPPTAISTEPLIDPTGGVRVDVTAPAGTAVTLRDDVGPIDSVRVARHGATLVVPAVVGSIVAHASGETLRTRVDDMPRLRPVLVVGRAGWEGKYIAAALEERGWPVIARFSVAPGVEVAQGGPVALDTAQLSAIVALDSSIADYGAAVARFVRSGGGLVLAASAARAHTVASVAPGITGDRIRPARLADDSLERGSAGFYPVVSIRPGGLAIERRREGVAVAARRVGAGRVIQVGFDESWRWRMAGGTSGPDAHRAWWSRVVGSVAYAPVSRPAPALGQAPLANMLDRLGPALPRPQAPGPRPDVDPRILLAITLLLLLVEWASRRLRGAR